MSSNNLHKKPFWIILLYTIIQLITGACTNYASKSTNEGSCIEHIGNAKINRGVTYIETIFDKAQFVCEWRSVKKEKVRCVGYPEAVKNMQLMKNCIVYEIFNRQKNISTGPSRLRNMKTTVWQQLVMHNIYAKKSVLTWNTTALALPPQDMLKREARDNLNKLLPHLSKEEADLQVHMHNTIWEKVQAHLHVIVLTTPSICVAIVFICYFFLSRITDLVKRCSGRRLAPEAPPPEPPYADQLQPSRQQHPGWPQNVQANIYGSPAAEP